MAQTNKVAAPTESLRPGTRVTVYGKAGTVVRHDGDDVTVRLDGEGQRADTWQRSQVELLGARARQPIPVLATVPAPAVDLLSARSVLAAASANQAELVAVRDAAPADCTPTDIGTALDRRFLTVLIEAHERAIDAVRMRNADLEKENKRLRDEGRHAAALVTATLAWRDEGANEYDDQTLWSAIERYEAHGYEVRCFDCLVEIPAATQATDGKARCEGCAEEHKTATDRQRRRDAYEGACDARGDEMRDEGRGA